MLLVLVVELIVLVAAVSREKLTLASHVLIRHAIILPHRISLLLVLHMSLRHTLRAAVTMGEKALTS